MNKNKTVNQCTFVRNGKFIYTHICFQNGKKKLKKRTDVCLRHSRPCKFLLNLNLKREEKKMWNIKLEKI